MISSQDENRITSAKTLFSNKVTLTNSRDQRCTCLWGAIFQTSTDFCCAHDQLFHQLTAKLRLQQVRGPGKFETCRGVHACSPTASCLSEESSAPHTSQAVQPWESSHTPDLELPGFTSKSCHLLAGGPLTSCLMSLDLGFLIYNVGIIILTPQLWCED